MIESMDRLAGALPELAEELAVVALHLRDSVVHVETPGRGAGSGVIWQSDGLIVTNHHVATGEGAQVTLADGRDFPARVVARDPIADLAALRIAAVGLPAVATRDAADLRVGEIVLAAGNPLGIRGAVTAGIVSAVGGGLRQQGGPPRGIVQADIDLLPGNSGGALADAEGRVVGINAMVVGGLALAVPSETVAVFLARAGLRRPQP